MDPALLDILHALQPSDDGSRPLEVICGYRSPETNARLAAVNPGVARNSFHVRGQACDIRMPGVEIGRLHEAALALRAGGVGYYPRSGFIHVDTGPVRTW